MKLYVLVMSSNAYGGHLTLSPIGDFLLRDAPAIGDAIDEIVVTINIASAGPAQRTLESHFEEHMTRTAKLPEIIFRRASKKAEIRIASNLEVARVFDSWHRLSLALFEQGVDEVVESLSLLHKRLKRSDDFNLDALLSHCRAARERIPRNEEDFVTLADELEAEDEARRDAMSPWEKLGIDWDQHHPRARDILDEPFYWDCADDFSPNGNDTGSDLLEAYRDWLKKHRDGQPMQFLEHLAKQWGFDGVDEMDEDILDEAAIGLAFADIKLRGTCDGEARRRAMRSIKRQRTQAETATHWAHREDRLKYLEAIGNKLQQVIEFP